jgi:tetratricopeptide (TPR) repeat protein
MPEVAAAIEKAKSSPQDYDAQMAAADLYYQIQRFDDAAKFYEAASKISPNENEPVIKAGDSYFDAAETARENDDQASANQKFAQAETWYSRALTKDPKNVAVRTDLGLTFFFREPSDLDRAIKEFKASLAIQPDHEKSLQNLASAYKEKGDDQNYRETIEKLRKVNPSNPLLTKPGSN